MAAAVGIDTERLGASNTAAALGALRSLDRTLTGEDGGAIGWGSMAGRDGWAGGGGGDGKIDTDAEGQTVHTASPSEIATWMSGKEFASAKTTYKVLEANPTFVIFGGTERTGQVMLPTALVVEWIHAYHQGRISAGDHPRAMREAVCQQSPWAKQLHSFETHLAAVTLAWMTHKAR